MKVKVKEYLVLTGCVIAVFTIFAMGCGAAEQSAGTSKFFKLKLSFEPEPPTVGRNVLFLRLSDKDGQPLKDAKVRLTLEMPAHGHGSSEQPSVEEEGDGQYKFFPVTFQMPGSWVLTFHIQAHQQQELVEFRYDIR